MWPDDYIAWAGRARPMVVSGIERELYRHLRTNPQWTTAGITTVAEQATRRAFDMANDHRRYQEYFDTEFQFRPWVYSVALSEALRLLIRHRLGESRFQLLSLNQRRILGMRYLDQLPPGDVAAILRTSAAEVREHTTRALEAFFQILGRPDAETET